MQSIMAYGMVWYEMKANPKLINNRTWTKKKRKKKINTRTPSLRKALRSTFTFKFIHLADAFNLQTRNNTSNLS